MDTPMGNTYDAQSNRQIPSSGYESPSASSVGSAQTLLPPPPSLRHITAARTLPDPARKASLPSRSPVAFSASDTRYHPYAASPGSPASITTSLTEASEHYATAGIPSSQVGESNLGPQKRAYRQRRKDPSCDACRERKVKCDATETSSCSECSSRGVKCQFTKETNRRMSSIKQVQDLQYQLAEAKQQIKSLRSMLDTAKHETSRARYSALDLAPTDQSRQKELPGTSHAVPGFEQVRDNLQEFSRGVFKVPPQHRHDVASPRINSPEPNVPPTPMVENLMKTFYDQIHRQAPMIHWPTFVQDWDKVRDAGNFMGMEQTWVALFFIILACGTLQASSEASPDHEGMRFYVIAARLFSTWTDNLNADHAKTALLISIFLYEQNARSASWVWLGTAIRMSQEIGLECEKGPWSETELMGRTRTYWSIVSWDRLLALQENKMFCVSIPDTDDSWPTAIGDHWIHPNWKGNLRPPENVPGFSTVGIIIPVVRIIGQLLKSLRAKTMTREVLQTYDEYFRTMSQNVPEPLQLHSDQRLEPFAFSSIVPFLMVKFQLYRHNLNAYATASDRYDALERCHTVSSHTVQYLRRTMRDSGPPNQGLQRWRDMLDAMAHNLLCRHIWRCTLILCLRGDYASALTCAQFTSAIGDARKLNVACGRNLAFFLDCLWERTTRGASQRDLESDLELLAYASGDLQGSTDGGFAWVGVQLGPPEAPGASSSSNLRALLDDETLIPPTALLTEKESNDWGGWEHIEQRIARFIDGRSNRQYGQHASYQPSQAHSPVYHRSTHNETQRLHTAPSPADTGTTTPASSTRASTPPPPPTGASRISIANII